MISSSVNKAPAVAPPPGQALRRARFQASVRYWLLIPTATIGSGLLLDVVLPDWPRGRWAVAAGLLLVAIGVALVQKSTADLVRHGEGTPAPQAPTRRLVSAGSYAWCRHPMAFGYDLSAWGVGLLLASPGMLLVSLPVMLVLQLRFLKREETLLERRFRQTWRDYRARVPLLIPRLFRERGLP